MHIDLRSLTLEDLQVLAKAADERPEYVRFWLGLRDRARKQFEKVPVLRTESDLTAYGLQCYGLAREVRVLNQLIEMPLTAKKALIREQGTHENQAEQGKPWDPPEE